jgi:iron complex outermembrane receptor protein
MQVQVAIQNLLNKRYWADASEFLGDAYLTPGQSRTVTLNLSIPF